MTGFNLGELIYKDLNAINFYFLFKTVSISLFLDFLYFSPGLTSGSILLNGFFYI